jgi:hypothetical protein
VARVDEFDLALVIGNRDPSQLPSKVIDYFTLPIPRAAFVRDPADDAIADYVRNRPGWVVVTDNAELGPAIADSVDPGSSRTDLAPPESESWPAVADEIRAFVAQVAANLGVRDGAAAAGSYATATSDAATQ